MLVIPETHTLKKTTTQQNKNKNKTPKQKSAPATSDNGVREKKKSQLLVVFILKNGRKKITTRPRS